jgi:hypothetical protein
LKAKRNRKERTREKILQTDKKLVMRDSNALGCNVFGGEEQKKIKTRSRESPMKKGLDTQSLAMEL